MTFGLSLTFSTKSSPQPAALSGFHAFQYVSAKMPLLTQTVASFHLDFFISIYYPAQIPKGETEINRLTSGYLDSWQGLFSIADDPKKLGCAQYHVPYLYYPVAQLFKNIARIGTTYFLFASARPDLPIVKLKEKSPVILFSHGHASFHGFHLALIQELASHGFIVIGIDHGCGDDLSVSPHALHEEYKNKVSACQEVPETLQGECLVQADEFYEYIYKVHARMLPECSRRVAEYDEAMLYLINHRDSSDIYQSMDLNNIAFVGQSLGGQAALWASVNSKYKDKIRALVSLDGAPPPKEIQMKTPSLILLSASGNGRIGAERYLTETFGEFKQYHAEIKIFDAGHSDFSDTSAIKGEPVNFHQRYSAMVLDFLKKQIPKDHAAMSTKIHCSQTVAKPEDFSRNCGSP